MSKMRFLRIHIDRIEMIGVVCLEGIFTQRLKLGGPVFGGRR